MNKKQWKGIIVFLSILTVVFAVTSIYYQSQAFYSEEVILHLKAVEYSLLTWICLIVIVICFICLSSEQDLGEERQYLIIDNLGEERKYTIKEKKSDLEKEVEEEFAEELGRT